jgi:hypothetical protein
VSLVGTGAHAQTRGLPTNNSHALSADHSLEGVMISFIYWVVRQNTRHCEQSSCALHSRSVERVSQPASLRDCQWDWACHPRN